ncbi:putative transcriptional regulator [Caballeronia udeis]|uniref:Transcriptional regulator n=1 Tax=Caballeronia udeis TaxID=1232866 RepID=A0ABW8MZ08_9BURK
MTDLNIKALKGIVRAPRQPISVEAMDEAIQGSSMHIITLGVSTLEEMGTRFVATWHGKAQGSYISFLSPELLFRTLTPARWTLIQAVISGGPISVDEITRRVNRASKTVHRDVRALLNAGVLDVNANGAVVFPYDAVHVDFVLSGSGSERETAPLERLCGSVQRYDDPTDPVESREVRTCRRSTKR